MRQHVEIDGRRIGPGEPPYVVAEMSANHGGRLEHALQVLRVARDCGADAVKLQTYTPDTLTIECDRPEFRVGAGSPWEGRTLHELYGEAHTPWEWHADLFAAARDLGITLFSTPFDGAAVDLLEELGAPAHKIASFEVVDLELIERVAATGKPVIMSTGMATLTEIEAAVETVRATGNEQLVLLKCTSAYPAPAEQMDLRTIPHLAQAFGVPTGLSDHTLGTAVPVAAVTLGAVLVEKHFCLSRDEGGPDSSFSMEPADLRRLLADTRTAQAALGRVRYAVSERERNSLVFRRSLFVVEDVAAGELLTRRNVRCIRPGHGLAPAELPRVLGRCATTDLTRGTPLDWDHVGTAPPEATR